jgi:type II restriction enzyme
LKLLAAGRLNAADENLKAIANVYYPIIKILRDQNGSSLEYHIDTAIVLIDSNTNKKILSVPISDFIKKSEELFKLLKKASGRSFSFPEINSFLEKVKVTNLAANYKIHVR